MTSGLSESTRCKAWTVLSTTQCDSPCLLGTQTEDPQMLTFSPQARVKLKPFFLRPVTSGPDVASPATVPHSFNISPHSPVLASLGRSSHPNSFTFGFPASPLRLELPAHIPASPAPAETLLQAHFQPPRPNLQAPGLLLFLPLSL